MWAVMNPVSP